jgi:hypothetical protein
MKRIKLAFVIMFFALTACGGGGSDSGSGSSTSTETTQAGNSIPAAFLGLYRGLINITLTIQVLSETESFPISFEVKSNGMMTVTVDDEDPVEFPIDNQGNFSGQAQFAEDGCTASLRLSGSVDGTTASGQLSGEASCEGLNGEVSGNFSATK